MSESNESPTWGCIWSEVDPSDDEYHLIVRGNRHRPHAAACGEGRSRGNSWDWSLLGERNQLHACPACRIIAGVL